MKNKKSSLILAIPLVLIFAMLCFGIIKGTFSTDVIDSDYKIHFVAIGKDAILVESNGHFGLIDTAYASNKYGNLPYDKYSDVRDNSITIINYLKEIGVSYLDFVILTNNHSDHIGGVAELCDSTFVNSNTTFIYKEYEELYNLENSEEINYGNMYFYNRAITAMKDKGVIMQETKALSEHNCELKGVLKDAQIKKYGEGNDSRDYIEFKFFGSNIRIYNLHTESRYEENANSLVQMVTMGNKKMLFMSDLTVDNNLEQTLGKEIKDVDLLKVGNQGRSTSSSLEFLENVKPEIAVVFNKSSIAEEFAVPLTYLRNKNSMIYRPYNESENNNMAVVAAIGSSAISMYTYDENNNLTMSADTLKDIVSDGFYYDANTISTSSFKSLYIKDGKFLTGWQDLDIPDNEAGEKGKYYFDEKGIMLTGWQELPNSQTGEKAKYYFHSSGVMATGLIMMEYNDDYESFYFDDTGVMQTGWHQIIYDEDDNEKTFYFMADGVMAKGAQKINDKLYYFHTSEGYMYSTPGLNEIGGEVYYFNDDNTLKTGWHELSNGKLIYFSDKNGAPITGKAVLEYENRNTWNYFDSENGYLLLQINFDNNFVYNNKNGYITDLSIGMSVSRVMNKINKHSELFNIAILDKTGNEKKSDAIMATGDRLIIYKDKIKLYEYTFGIDGDLDSDGRITQNDATLLAKYILNNNSLDGIYLDSADVDNNNKININDIIKVTRYVVQNWE